MVLLIIWSILKLNIIILVSIILSSIFIIPIIFTIIIKKEQYKEIRAIYEEDPNQSLEEIISKTGASQRIVLIVLSKIEKEKEKLKPEIIIGRKSIPEYKKEEIYIDKEKELEIQHGKIEITNKCYVLHDKNNLKIIVDKSEDKSTLYPFIFISFIFFICDILFFQLFSLIFKKNLNLYLIILTICLFVLIIFINALLIGAVIYWFYNRNRIIEFEMEKISKEIKKTKISPNFRLLGIINFSEINSLLIKRNYSKYYFLEIILNNKKHVKIAKTRKFTECRELGKIISKFLNVGLTSDYYERFIYE